MNTSPTKTSPSAVHTLAAALCLCICFWSNGCGSLEQPALAKSYFAIDPGIPVGGTGSSAANRPIVTVIPVHISPPYDGVWFVYKIGPSQFDFDRYDVFVAPPASLLTGSLIGWLNRAGPLPAVADASSLRSDLMLESEITALYIDSTVLPARKAVIAGRFFLIRRRPAQYQLLAEIPFAQSVAVATQSPAGFAEALGQAWRQVLVQLRDKLTKEKESIAKEPP